MMMMMNFKNNTLYFKRADGATYIYTTGLNEPYVMLNGKPKYPMHMYCIYSNFHILYSNKTSYNVTITAFLCAISNHHISYSKCSIHSFISLRLYRSSATTGQISNNLFWISNCQVFKLIFHLDNVFWKSLKYFYMWYIDQHNLLYVHYFAYNASIGG